MQALCMISDYLSDCSCWQRWFGMLFEPGCGLSPITARRLDWRRWSAWEVDCGCATSVVIGMALARLMRVAVLMSFNNFS